MLAAVNSNRKCGSVTSVRWEAVKIKQTAVVTVAGYCAGSVAHHRTRYKVGISAQMLVEDVYRRLLFREPQNRSFTVMTNTERILRFPLGGQ